MSATILKHPRANKGLPKLTNVQLGAQVEAELHRLRITFGGWYSHPTFGKKLEKAIQLVGRKMERPMAFVPEALAGRVFGRPVGLLRINVGSFSGRPTLTYMLDREEIVTVTYSDKTKGVVLYADRLLESLREVQK